MSRISRAIGAIGAIGLSGASLMANATTTVYSEDFSAGNPVSGTQYGLIGAGGSTFQGGYRVVADPDGAFPNNRFASYFDHTTNDSSGLMMYFDGTGPATTLWSATVPVAAGTTYMFSYWVSAVTGTAQPVLSFAVDGQTDPTTATNAGIAAQWIKYSTSFVRSVAGDVVLSIRDMTTDVIGNDGAIDDIEITFDATQVGPGDPNNPIPEPEQAALMAGGLGILGWMTRRRVRHPSSLGQTGAVPVA